jgi:hypothetical protein
MFTKSKIVLAFALVLGATLSASAATRTSVVSNAQTAAYDAIPGYGSDGATVAIPNPDRR